MAVKLYKISSMAILSLIIALLACQKENLKPTAFFTVFPSFGDSRTVFYFNAEKSIDNATVSGGLQVRWDWEGDSIWDTPYSFEKEVARRFENTGWHFVTMEVLDHSGNTATYRDTFNVWSSTPETSTLVDTRDGQEYKTVKFNDQWLMSENLRYGTWIQDTIIPSQFTGTEFHLYDNDFDNLEYGGLYTWSEIMNYKEELGGQGICPDGWHVPTFKEWNELIGFENYYRDDLHNVATTAVGTPPIPINIAYYYGQDSPSGLNLLFLGSGRLPHPYLESSLQCSGVGESVRYWTSHPLSTIYRNDIQEKWSLYMQLTKHSYGIRLTLTRFNPLYAYSQAEMSVNYLRCFQDK